MLLINPQASTVNKTLTIIILQLSTIKFSSWSRRVNWKCIPNNLRNLKGRMLQNGEPLASCWTVLRDGLVNIILLLHMWVHRSCWNMQKWSSRNTQITICCSAWVTNSKLKRWSTTLNSCSKDQVDTTWQPFWFRKSGKVTNLTAISSNWNSWWRRHRSFKEGLDYTCSNPKPTKS